MEIQNASVIIEAKDKLIDVLEKELQSAINENDFLKREVFQLRTRLDDYKYQADRKRFYSPDDIAVMLNLSKSTVLNYIRKGLLNHAEFEDIENGKRKTYRISAADFNKFVESCPIKNLE